LEKAFYEVYAFKCLHPAKTYQVAFLAFALYLCRLEEFGCVQKIAFLVPYWFLPPKPK